MKVLTLALISAAVVIFTSTVVRRQYHTHHKFTFSATTASSVFCSSENIVLAKYWTTQEKHNLQAQTNNERQTKTMPPIAPSSHLTSCIQVWAAEFTRRKVFLGAVDPKHSVLALMSVIGDRFARYLPPNFCVQLRQHVMHKELRLFFAPAMRNSLTMCHVFKMRLLFSVVEGGKTDSEDELKLLFSDMGSKLTYITLLDVKMDVLCCKLMCDSATLRGAMFASLPRSLQSVSLHSDWIRDTVEIDANDIRALAAMPHLHELRLTGSMAITRDGIAELFRRDKPADQLFFPNLRCIEAAQDHNNAELLRLAADSIILPRLWEFAMWCQYYQYFSNVNAASFSASLRCLSLIRVVGTLFSNLNFSGPLDLSPLREMRKIGGKFFFHCDFNGHALDLSVLPNLEEVGSSFLSGARNIAKLILPPNLRRVGHSFCASSSFTALDFSAVAHSLESINVTSFAQSSYLVEFDSSLFAGKIVGDGDRFLCYCFKLVEVNLSGFRKVEQLGDGFLYSCSLLRTVRGMDGLAAVKRVGTDFMCGTQKLVECDFSRMVSLENVSDERFLEQCFLGGSALEKSGLNILRAIVAANSEKDKQLHSK